METPITAEDVPIPAGVPSLVLRTGAAIVIEVAPTGDDVPRTLPTYGAAMDVALVGEATHDASASIPVVGLGLEPIRAIPTATPDILIQVTLLGVGP